MMTKQLYEALRAYMAGADEGHVSLEVDKKARAAIAAYEAAKSKEQHND